MSEWISVKDRLPESGERVIVFVPDYKEVCCDYVYARKYADIKGNDFFRPFNSGYSCIRTATHWMPLPEPPEVDE
jgi:hypothetical protein